MKVFISWSGERSRACASALRDWLPDVIQGVTPWMSAADIEAGARWSHHVQDELNESRFGVICITRDNQFAPWLLFETGALAKTIEDTYVCPYLIDLEPSEIAGGPLTQFQAKQASESGTHDLVRAMNRAAKEVALPEEKLDRAFKRWWPDLGKTLESLPASKNANPKRAVEDMVEEILVATREIKRAVQSGPSDWDRVFLPLLASYLDEEAEPLRSRNLSSHLSSAKKSAFWDLNKLLSEREPKRTEEPGVQENPPKKESSPKKN